MISRTRDCSQDAKNIQEKNAIQERNEERNDDEEMINKRTREFKAFIHRESSNFERMKVEMTILHDENVASKIQNVLRRIDSALKRERERERARKRKREKTRKKTRERTRERERESSITVEREENLIFVVDEERQEQSREREPRDLSRSRVNHSVR